MNMMFEPLRKYAQFSGRARRTEYWMFVLLTLILYAGSLLLLSIAGLALTLFGGTPTAMGGAIFWVVIGLLAAGLFIPSLALAFRRLHDVNMHAWWLLVGFVPYVGGLVLLVFYVLPGTKGPNRFGPDPKGDETTAEVFA